MLGLSSERHPLYWFDIRLDYSKHALKRLEERGIDKIDYLPPKARFITRRKNEDDDAFLFVYQQNQRDVCIAISSHGVVLTVFWDEHSKNYANVSNKFKKGFEYQVNLDKYPHRALDEWVYM